MNAPPAMAIQSPRLHSIQDCAFVVHSRPWRETSLLVELFSQSHGRMLALARGARRPQSALRGRLEPFHRLWCVWGARGEVPNLTKVEWSDQVVFLRRHAMMAGHYMNELLHHTLPLNDAHEHLFSVYAQTLMALSDQNDARVPSANQRPAQEFIEACLRRFEVALLRDIGYGLRLNDGITPMGDNTQPIAPLSLEMTACYTYWPQQGITNQEHHKDHPPINHDHPMGVRLHGDSLLEMHSWLTNTSESLALPMDSESRLRRLAEQKQLIRQTLTMLLPSQPLASRHILYELSQMRQKRNED